MTKNTWQPVLDFWFTELTPEQWYKASDHVDHVCRTRFGALHAAAAACELYSWREAPEGRLAEIILLDQFSRNMFRGTPGAFAHDPLALALAQSAIAAGADTGLPPHRRAFFYIPWMHSESALIHDTAVRLFSAPGLEENLDFEYRHKAIIDRFGRYPHRNAILGRTSTPTEIAFLAEPGSSF